MEQHKNNIWKWNRGNNMNAKQLIKFTKECIITNWKNSDLPLEVEGILTMMAEHMGICEECRIDFDNAQFTGETLIDFSSKYLRNQSHEDWSCIPNQRTD